MKRVFLFILLGYIAFSCRDKEANSFQNNPSVHLSGKISHLPESPTMFIVKVDDSTQYEHQIYVDSLFSFTIPLEKREYIKFFVGNNYGTLYTIPGDSIFLSTDYREFNQELVFKGDRSIENTYLLHSHTLNRKGGTFSPFHKADGDFDQVIPFFNNYKKKMNALLKDLPKRKVDKQFYNFEKKRITINYYKKLLAQVNLYRFRENKYPTESAELKKVLAKFPLKHDYLRFRQYIPLLHKKLEIESSVDGELDIDLFVKAIENIQSEELFNELTWHVAAFYLESMPNEEHVNQLTTLCLEQNTNDEHKGQINELFERRNATAKGSIAPDFKMMSVDNETFQLSDFRGKLVLINFWKMPCNLCMGQRLYLENLSNNYSNEEITFLHVFLGAYNQSYDESFSRWIEFEKQQKSQSISVMVEESDAEHIHELYFINFVPRLSMIDRDGRFIQSIANYPINQDKVEALIEDHL